MFNEIVLSVGDAFFVAFASGATDGVGVVAEDSPSLGGTLLALSTSGSEEEELPAPKKSFSLPIPRLLIATKSSGYALTSDRIVFDFSVCDSVAHRDKSRL